MDLQMTYTSPKRQRSNVQNSEYQFTGSNALTYDYPTPPMSRPPTPTEGIPITTTRTPAIPVTAFPTVSTPTTSITIAHSAPASSAPAPTTTFQQPYSVLPAFAPAISTPPQLPTTIAPRPVTGPVRYAGIAPLLSLTTTGLPAIRTVGSQVGRTSRRIKAHVASACVNCRRAHLSCDVSRPCRRCVDSGKQDTCFDVQHKKRGRPRLRAAGEAWPAESPQAGPSTSTSAQAVADARPSAQTRTRGESFRSHQSHGSEGSSFPPSQESPVTTMTTPASGERAFARTRTRRAESFQSHYSQGSGSTVFTPITPHSAAYTWPSPAAYFVPPTTPIATELPTAFLDLDLVIVRANNAFRQIMRTTGDLSGARIHEVATVLGGESFLAIRNRLRDERERIEPSYLPPIVQGAQNALQHIRDEMADQLTQGFSDHTYTWTTNAGGPAFPVRVRLAKASIYFVVVTVPIQAVMMQPYPAPQGFAYMGTTQGLPMAQAQPVIASVGMYPAGLLQVTMPDMMQQMLPPEAQRIRFVQENPGRGPPEVFQLGSTGRQLLGSRTALLPTGPTTYASAETDDSEEAGPSSRAPRKRRRLDLDEVLQ